MKIKDCFVGAIHLLEINIAELDQGGQVAGMIGCHAICLNARKKL